MARFFTRNRISFLAAFFLIVALVASGEAATNLSYVYDANGNLISGDGHYYEYNDANQLVKVRHGDQNGPVLAEYFYDYIGQRIKKIENGVTTYYIGKHYEEVRDGVDIKKTDYYFANGERVAKKDSTGNVYYYHSDHLGGTNVITDSSGNLVERVKYYPFGEIREGGSEKYQFTGKEKDKLTDWYYFEARYYNPEFKHFTQADTVDPDLYDPQDLNKYAYVLNNPLRLIDPSGHASIGSNEWNQEFYRASLKDRAKFEKMQRELKLWFAQGGQKLKSESEAYEALYRSLVQSTKIYFTVEDALLTGLSWGIPVGKIIIPSYKIARQFVLYKYFPEVYGGDGRQFAFETSLEVASIISVPKIHPNAAFSWNQLAAGRIGPKRVLDLSNKVQNYLTEWTANEIFKETNRYFERSQ
jgi:RHS repeat-associated protein